MALAPSRDLFGVPSSAIIALIEAALIGRVHAADRVEDLAVHGGDGVQHALAAIALLVAVAQLDRFMRAGRGAGRHRGAADDAAFQRDVDFDGGIAAAVENLAADDVRDCAHVSL